MSQSRRNRARVRPSLEALETRLCPHVAGPGVNLNAPDAIHAGDTVTIEATLGSTDANENGEGEPLVIQSSGGFTATVGAYAQTRSVTFKATQDGELLTATIQNYDGD